MSTCSQLNCYGSNSCCGYIEGQPYCYTASQCKDDPIWQAAVIPAVLFFLAVCLIVVVVYKLKTKHKNPMQVTNFAKQEIRRRMQPKLSEGRLQTLTSIY